MQFSFVASLELSTGQSCRVKTFQNPQIKRASEAFTSETLVFGGDEKIRTSDTLLGYAPLAGECLRPLGHVSEPVCLVAKPEAEF